MALTMDSVINNDENCIQQRLLEYSGVDATAPNCMPFWQLLAPISVAGQNVQKVFHPHPSKFYKLVLALTNSQCLNLNWHSGIYLLTSGHTIFTLYKSHGKSCHLINTMYIWFAGIRTLDAATFTSIKVACNKDFPSPTTTYLQLLKYEWHEVIWHVQTSVWAWILSWRLTHCS